MTSWSLVETFNIRVGISVWAESSQCKGGTFKTRGQKTNLNERLLPVHWAEPVRPAFVYIFPFLPKCRGVQYYPVTSSLLDVGQRLSRLFYPIGENASVVASLRQKIGQSLPRRKLGNQHKTICILPTWSYYPVWIFYCIIGYPRMSGLCMLCLIQI